MNYVWVSVGDQEHTIRKHCPLGPYLLELVETYWEDGKLMVDFIVLQWNDKDRDYDTVETDLKPQEYDRKTSHTVLEDWYATNVLIEDMLGREDEDV